MAKPSFPEALRKLYIQGIEEEEGLIDDEHETVMAKCGCGDWVLLPKESTRDHRAERELAAMGFSSVTVTNRNKPVGLLGRPKKYKAEVRIYRCSSCGTRIGTGFIGNIRGKGLRMSAALYQLRYGPCAVPDSRQTRGLNCLVGQNSVARLKPHT